MLWGLFPLLDTISPPPLATSYKDPAPIGPKTFYSHQTVMQLEGLLHKLATM